MAHFDLISRVEINKKSHGKIIRPKQNQSKFQTGTANCKLRRANIGWYKVCLYFRVNFGVKGVQSGLEW